MNIQTQFQYWINLDNQIKILNEQLKEIKEKKNRIANNIISSIENIRSENYSIVLDNEKLKIVTNKTTQPITFKYLEVCLKDMIKNEYQIKLILDYIKAKREIKEEKEIKRYKNI